MTMTTSQEGPSTLVESITGVELQLMDLRADLLEMQKRIRAGDVAGLKDSTKAISDIRQWLKIAHETEILHEERRRKEKGIVKDYALDFDEARHQIGCRLDRLRRTCGAGRLPK
ncbi:hypothetical protein DI396_00970 [Litorivita pollutaquae]|uniref:Uncharacterized protein n=1 Tax=Litorivita pollutaquae TaxID=2200892 RepID=A0A2V4NUN6_9RHOB|nr:hypothetical protein [Litorivita pollutaquae]OUS20839.1 hypothetical protein A9Q95_11305 [Rhodobacterales bacterium 59_46_T64]PYC48716.1 hypothetical protein DI396_00970 [Litorivita pollutaquae]